MADPDAGAVDPDRDSLTDLQHREWRRWTLEQLGQSAYAVVPVDELVETLYRREPTEVSRSRVRAALTERVLPVVARENLFEYDTERQVVVNYGVTQ